MIDPEIIKLIPKIDITTSEKLASFKKWQYDDGSLKGLQKLYKDQQALEIEKEARNDRT